MCIRRTCVHRAMSVVGGLNVIILVRMHVHARGRHLHEFLVIVVLLMATCHPWLNVVRWYGGIIHNENVQSFLHRQL